MSGVLPAANVAADDVANPAADEAQLIAACTALAAQLGLGRVQPQVIGRFSNRALRLSPLPVVARVPTGTAALRDVWRFAQREVALVGALAAPNASHPDAHDALVIAPLEPQLAGPHACAGFVITLWHEAQLLPGPPDAVASGVALAACHRALRACPAPVRAQLVAWQPFDEIAALLAHAHVQAALSAADRALLGRQAQRLEEQLRASGAAMQPVHGDAHLNNALSTARGMRWHDWEDAFLGPVEWDLACLVSGARVLGSNVAWSEAALAAYPDSHDAALLELCVHARTVFAAAWMSLLAGEDPVAQARLAGRLAWLRSREV